MQHQCDHTLAEPLDAEQVNRAVRAAQARAPESKGRWTAPRLRVFEQLVQHGGPIKAYDLIAAHDPKAPGATKPPTVYRALEFLESVGLAHRIPSLNAYVACLTGKEAHAASFLICDCCGVAEEFDPGIAHQVIAAAREHRFEPRILSVEVRGRCGKCATHAA